MTDKRKIEIIKLMLKWFKNYSMKFYKGNIDGICIIVRHHIDIKISDDIKTFNNYLMTTTKRRWVPVIDIYI